MVGKRENHQHGWLSRGWHLARHGHGFGNTTQRVINTCCPCAAAVGCLLCSSAFELATFHTSSVIFPEGSELRQSQLEPVYKALKCKKMCVGLGARIIWRKDPSLSTRTEIVVCLGSDYCFHRFVSCLVFVQGTNSQAPDAGLLKDYSRFAFCQNKSKTRYRIIENEITPCGMIPRR